MTEQAVQVYQGNQFSREQLDVMRATVAAGTSPAEFALFLEVCKHRKLNPFNREIYVIPSKGKMTFQVSIDGLRLLAERSGKYQGQIGPLWCGKDGEWKEVWLEDKPPMAAKVGVIRSDFKEPIFSVAKYASYAGTTPIWQKMPDLMLAKCAESLALRRAFPDQMAGLYTHEEMAQAENDLPASVLAQEAVEGEVVEETAQANSHQEPQYPDAIIRLLSEFKTLEPAWCHARPNWDRVLLTKVLELQTLEPFPEIFDEDDINRVELYVESVRQKKAKAGK